MNRYDFKGRGQRFVTFLILLLLGTIASYIGLKLKYPPSENVPKVEDYARLGARGRLTITDPMTLNWVISADHGDALIARMKERASDIEKSIQEAIEAVRTLDARRVFASNQELSILGPTARIVINHLRERRSTIIAAVSDGKLTKAKEEWDEFQSASAKSGSPVLESLSAEVVSVTTGLDRVASLLGAQRADYQSLGPPGASSCKFWTSCWLSMLEVLYFSFCGVIANLLVNSAHFLSAGNYRPSERWVAYTKLCYGPILSLVLVLAVMFGWIDFGSYQVRAYTLPLLAFILGYFSRRVVRLVDRLGTRVLGEAEKSIDAGPRKIAELRRKQAEDWLRYQSPRSLSDLRRAAREAATEITRATVVAKEAKS
ncbi:MAG: hypothetical protein AAF957_07485 [Planctomycetota bacterium]